MKTKKQTNLIAAAVICLTLFSAACKKNTDTSNPYQTAPVTGVKLVANAKFGNIVTDNNGRSLYFLSQDVAGSSTCLNGCAVTWPVFYVENPSFGSGLVAADFAVITRPDGSKQTTYKGWPLYYNMNDAKPGDTNGDAVANLWAIAKPDYAVMFGNAQLIGADGQQYTSQGVPGQEVSQYLTDANGHTLYSFKNDSSGKNKFTKADFSNNKNFPIDSVGQNVGSVPTILDKTKFITINVFGKTQLVYKGRPMYFAGADSAKRGNTKGVSLPTPGAAVWKILNTNTVGL